MPRITESVHVNNDAASLWREVGPFASVGEWHPMLVDVEATGEEQGSLRTASGRDGGKQIERLIEVAPKERFYRYSIESTSLPVRDYVGELRVDDDGDGTSTVVWSADFKVISASEDDVIKSTRSFLRAGLDNVKTLYHGHSA